MRSIKVRRRKRGVGDTFLYTRQPIKNPPASSKPLEMLEVDSSNIQAIGYKNGALFVRFNNWITYKYDKVPAEVYEELMKSDSKGSYLYHKIRDVYEGIVVDMRGTYI